MPGPSTVQRDYRPRIEVAKLDVVFGHGPDRVHAVRDDSFAVGPGESFGPVGESGLGKSTELRALCGLNPDWTGRIAIAGEAQGPRRPKSFFKRVQMVFQDPYGSLHPHRIVVTDPVFQPIGKQSALRAVQPLNKTLHQTLPPKHGKMIA